jgi:hypothetical protein
VSTLFIVLGAWLALNVALLLMMMNRYRRPRIRRRLFRWVIGPGPSIRALRFAHILVTASRHRA